MAQRKVNAIALLTLRPHPELIKFYSAFIELGYDVFVVVDDNNYKTEPCAVQFIQIDERLCKRNGYRHLALIEKKNGCCAWDKALFFFSRVNVSHENVWFIEDDVFVPRPSVISKIDQTHQKADVVSTDFHIKQVGEEDKWYWWKYVPSQLVPEPWAHSMVCAIRLSRGMLNIFDYFVQRNKMTLPSINIMQKIIKQDYMRRNVCTEKSLLSRIYISYFSPPQ